MAIHLLNLPVVRLLTGRFASAGSLQMEALKRLETEVGREHPVIVVSPSNLGYASLCRDDPATALARRPEAEAIGRRGGQQEDNWGAMLKPHPGAQLPRSA